MYQALYRVWRPRTFSDMVGQEGIVRTLKNQVKTGRIGHAYLFCGSRGTGKTSAAKILSRAVNCENPHDGDPCGECSSCKSILADTSLDVYEMDAASNSRVEEIRELLEKVDYPPQFSKYKVYIIDEVHMLSTSAFNALLKTLEEPPSYMVFILATTEPQKIPSTILSRCQRYDFGRFTDEELTGRMRYILEETGHKADEEALRLIAQAAEGGMRDALSILDMCLGDDSLITEATVRSVLGSADKQFLFSFCDAIAAQNSAEALKKCDELMRSGRDVGVFLKDLSRHLRDVMAVKLCGPDTVPGGQAYVEQGQRFSAERLLRILGIYQQAQGDTRWSTSARSILEIATLRCCQSPEGTDTTALMERIGEMERVIDEMKRNGVRVQAAPAAANKAAAASDIPEEAEAPIIEDPVPDGSKLPKDIWNDALKELKRSAPFAFGFVSGGTYGGFKDGVFRIIYENRHACEMAAQKFKPSVEDAIARSGGAGYRFEAQLKGDVKAPERSKIAENDIEQLAQMFGRDKIRVE